MGRLYYVFILVVALLLMIIYDQYDAFLLALVLILTPLPLYFFGKWAGKGLSVSAAGPSHASRGEPVEVAVTVTGSFLPLLGAPDMMVDGKGYDSYEEVKGGIRFYFAKNASHCGRESLGKAVFSWKDPFGLFHFHKVLPTSSYLVYPKAVGNYHAALASLRRLTGSDEVEYFGATPYKPGDNPHLINWKITARKDDVYVRDSYPADSEKIVLAADYEKDPVLRDTVGDALYSLGLALLSARIPFRFAFATAKGPMTQAIHSREEWMDGLAGFLRAGTGDALRESTLSPYIPICYLTGNPNPPISPILHPAIWCASPDAPRAALSGQAAIYEALGGTK